MIKGVRENIEQILSRQGLMHQGQNLSLFFSRLCMYIDEPGESEYKDKALQRLESGLSTEALAVYKIAFKQWRDAWEAADHALCFEMICQTPLIVGMGDQNIHEFGISLQHPWGTPFIPGSAIKGVAASYANGAGGDDWRRTQTPSETDGKYAEAVFGGINAEGARTAGGIGFADAWWIPDSKQPFQRDIVNVHYRKYYQQEADAWPDGTEAPLPIQFIVISPNSRFLIVMNGPSEWCRVAKQIVAAAAEEIGFGAKTRVGYGRMRYIENAQELKARLGSMDAEELADLFRGKGGDPDYQSFFEEAVKKHTCTRELYPLFKKYRPAALLLDRLKREKPSDLKSARKIRKEFASLIPASGIDTSDPDIQNIFNFCRRLATQGVKGTWLEAFAYGFDDMAKGKSYVEVEELLVAHLDGLQNGKVDWPDLERLHEDIEKLKEFSTEKRKELLGYIEMLL